MSKKIQFADLLKLYKKTYLQKKYQELDESATRLMVNYFLTNVLGYTQLDEIKTEYAIKGTYADYVIQLERKKKLIIEVKAIQIDLSENHLRQSVAYAANEGVDWILLTNGKQFELYKVIFSKPINSKKIFSFDLTDNSQFKESVEYLEKLTKRSMINKELDKYWKKFQALEPTNLAKILYSPEVIKVLKKKLKISSSINFNEEDIIDSLYDVIVLKIPSNKPKIKNNKSATDTVKSK